MTARTWLVLADDGTEDGCDSWIGHAANATDALIGSGFDADAIFQVSPFRSTS
ncbi:hypothetical protein AERO9AM_30609 [Aeromicrobium sp. 9AM]|nr:hypothetical protein AERO9AM_30609 [Aeromicrobium sp. 9AM]